MASQFNFLRIKFVKGCTNSPVISAFLLSTKQQKLRYPQGMWKHNRRLICLLHTVYGRRATVPQNQARYVVDLVLIECKRLGLGWRTSASGRTNPALDFGSFTVELDREIFQGYATSLWRFWARTVFPESISVTRCCRFPYDDPGRHSYPTRSPIGCEENCTEICHKCRTAKSGEAVRKCGDSRPHRQRLHNTT